MAATTPFQQQACNHRALEVVSVLLLATVIALSAAVIMVAQGAGASTVLTTGASLFLGVFTVGLAAVTYVKHGG
ncbi:hypothetical protein [Streptomyces rishiriensis]|uniref:Uncharacterized protein n=1 Tax=Streptomyces rishiriensis TaxID=68264 RepID=A0ABU0P2J6_STRRH|nr:hypothetical protein [Streptomyces rishiriensis]MDQ0585621.1 hypothetical protein [Streptomyces rishiriensis]